MSDECIIIDTGPIIDLYVAEGIDGWEGSLGDGRKLVVLEAIRHELENSAVDAIRQAEGFHRDNLAPHDLSSRFDAWMAGKGGSVVQGNFTAPDYVAWGA